MRNLIKEEREHLLKLGYQFVKYEDAQAERFRSEWYKDIMGEDYYKWTDEYVMEDGTIICLPSKKDEAGWMKYSIKYLRGKGVI